ncbi:MAG: PEP-CTERM sorting domain-containing protein [Planctomycetes bacterium]|nr:PEP-CTERM sorting domain-containing protein [Planctomycetota bacterium]MBU4399406.1 PEP-CTERM sorting domain-containing protein [Planctomycetota bacterium]
MAAILAIVGWACVAPCSAGLISNGSFENGMAIGGGGLATPTVQQVDIVDWAWGDPSNFDWYASSAWGEFNPQDGDKYLLCSNRWISSQDFAVSAGTTYIVDYYTSKRNDVVSQLESSIAVASGTVTGVEVLAGGGIFGGSGTATLTLTAPGSPTKLSWTLQRYSFTTSESTTATFKITSAVSGNGSNDAYIDSVTLVPEPGTLALLATGLIGLLCYAWRKRR